MRILMLTQAYPPFIGGSERYAQDLSIELVARGHEVTVATLWSQGSPEFELDRGVRVRRIRGTVHRAARLLFSDPTRGHAPPFPDPEIVMALRRIVVITRPQIVHSMDWMVHSFLPLKTWSGASLVMTLHDYSLRCAKKTLMFRDVPCNGPHLIRCLGCAGDHYGRLKGAATVLANMWMGLIERATVDMFIPVSQAVAVESSLTDNAHSFEVIPNFVLDIANDLQDEFNPLLDQLPREDFLLYVGALSRKKGLDMLLSAYARLIDAPPLVLIGYETIEDPVDLTVLPDNVIVLKNWPHGAVTYAWKRSLLGLVPSVWPEPFGIVVIEAMLAGRPVIASHHGGIPDIVIDGETGILISPGDPAAIQRAIERLLDDPALRQRMGQAGKHRVTKFRAGTVVPRIEQVYRNLMYER